MHLYEARVPVADTNAAQRFYIEMSDYTFARHDFTPDIVFLWAGAGSRSISGMWVRAVEWRAQRLRRMRFSARAAFEGSGSPRTADATVPQNLRLTPAFAKSYGVASSRLYSLDAVKRWWLVVVIVIVLVLVGAGAAVYVDWTWKRKLSPRGGRPFLTHVSCRCRRSSKETTNGATIR